MNVVSIPLTTENVEAHGEPIDKLVMPYPTGELIMKLGFPFLVHAEGQLELRPKVAGQYVVHLAKVPASTVGALNPPDVMAVQAAVLGFFGRSMDEVRPSSSSSPSTSPDSGA